eukprot:766761-Hanusia_phi.AAC.1
MIISTRAGMRETSMRLMQGDSKLLLLLLVVMMMTMGGEVFGFQASMKLTGRATGLSRSSLSGLRRLPANLRVPSKPWTSIALWGRKAGALALKAAETGEEEEGGNFVQFLDSSDRSLAVYPIGEDIKSRDIECEITKNAIFLSVNGNRSVELLACCQRTDCNGKHPRRGDVGGREAR